MLAVAVRGFVSFFFFNDTATTEIYTLSLHDALPISRSLTKLGGGFAFTIANPLIVLVFTLLYSQLNFVYPRSEEHTSELQSRQYLVCRLLLEKKNTRGRRDSSGAIGLNRTGHARGAL